MGIDLELKGLLAEHPKREIGRALLRLRTRHSKLSSRVLEVERMYFELVESLGLLPENTSHSEAMGKAHDILHGSPGGARDED